MNELIVVPQTSQWHKLKSLVLDKGRRRNSRQPKREQERRGAPPEIRLLNGVAVALVVCLAIWYSHSSIRSFPPLASRSLTAGKAQSPPNSARWASTGGMSAGRCW